MPGGIGVSIGGIVCGGSGVCGVAGGIGVGIGGKVCGGIGVQTG